MNEDSIFRFRILEGTGKTMNEANIYRMMNADEAADMLGVSEKMVRNLAQEDALPTWRPGTGTVRFPYWMMVYNISLKCGLPPEEAMKFVTGRVTGMWGDEVA